MKISSHSSWKEFYLDKIHPDWNFFFEQEAKKDYFFPFLEKIYSEYKKYSCWPILERVFYLFRIISPDKIKVVILGQDPYHIPEVADGLAFSTKKGNYIPKSLKNIFLELSNDLNCPLPRKGNLFSWVKEGVFLMNVALTVIEGRPSSHIDLWKTFTYSLINYLKQYKGELLVWVFWGNNSKRIQKDCEISSENSVTSSHPSPYSAEYGFFFSYPFSRVNQLLTKKGVLPINWMIILEENEA